MKKATLILLTLISVCFYSIDGNTRYFLPALSGAGMSDSFQLVLSDCERKLQVCYAKCKASPSSWCLPGAPKFYKKTGESAATLCSKYQAACNENCRRVRCTL